MTRGALSRTLVAMAASVAFIGAVLLVDGSLSRAGRPDGDLGRGGPHVADQNPDAQEQATQVQERQAAYAAALANGTAGRVQPITRLTPTGWVGEQVVDATVDDWEPAIAADPRSNYVYVLTTRYGVPEPCKGNCPSPVIELLISADNGTTWSPAKPLCACQGKGQFDPIIEVVPNSGDVYALFMIEFNVWFTKSTDHGRSWSPPVATYGNVAWNDKPVLAVSNDGRDVYASWNGPTSGDPWVAQSHDAGATWSQVKVIDSSRYYYAFGADVANDGTVYFAESGVSYTAAGKGGKVSGPIEHHVFVSRDRGQTWQDQLVATVQPGIPCVAVGCTTDFYTGHTALTVDGAGNAVVLYDGAATDGGLQAIYARRSSSFGATWSPPARLSVPTEQSVAPAVTSTGTGDIRAWYYQTSGGGNVDAWNVWYRRSIDGGTSWSAPLRISDATSGAPYITAAGFAEVYGDYGEIAITSAGKTIATWGEGISYTGPGGVWINRER
ncbi:MAG: exo-alpha-sialidase [Chloroflexi bacterium]|nr:exo-alpha-sialidase [Chloroflexota bacterium]